ncbi:hypothetical protein BH23ACT7_BH23ACT7_06820 [soil metagenome]
MSDDLLEAHAGPASGRRAARRAEARRVRRRRFALTAGVATVVAVAAVAWQVAAVPGAAPTGTAATGTAGPVTRGTPQDTLLLVRHPSSPGPATGVTLLAAGPGPDDATVLFVPAGMLVDIPGAGQQPLGEAFARGGAALAQAVTEDALGIEIDHAASIDEPGLGAFLGRSGGLALTVPGALAATVDGSSVERFAAGEQFLDGTRLAEYWAFRQAAEDELATFPRQQLVLSAFLRAAADEAVRDRLVGDGAPQLSTAADGAWLDAVLGRLGDAARRGSLDFVQLPVERLDGGPDGAAYRARRDGVVALRSGALAASVPRGGVAGVVRIEVLNGVGTPGVGAEVGRLLGGEQFRVVRTDNADGFGVGETRIVVHDDAERSIEVAEQVRRRLGVGTIQVSDRPDRAVDLTIVVGADFDPVPDPSGDTETEQAA